MRDINLNSKRKEQAKKVICLNTGIIYNSIHEVACETGYDRAGISKCCRGKAKSCGKDEYGDKLVWRFLEDYDENKVDEWVGEAYVRIICISNGIIYNSMRDAERKTNIDESSISLCCRGKLKSAGKDENGEPLVWRYLKDYDENKVEEWLKEAETYCKKRKIICINTGIIYESSYDAERKTDVAYQSINKCCQGKLKSAGKSEIGERLIWKYYEED